MAENSDRGKDERNKQEEERRREAVKLYYDHLKHLTTLAGATAVVELAIYRERLVASSLVVESLVFLTVCVVLCLYRMSIAIDAIEAGESTGTAYFLNLLFFTGLFLFVLAATNVPNWAGLVLVVGPLF